MKVYFDSAYTTDGFEQLGNPKKGIEDIWSCFIDKKGGEYWQKEWYNLTGISFRIFSVAGILFGASGET
jgi:hypothetical protein